MRYLPELDNTNQHFEIIKCAFAAAAEKLEPWPLTPAAATVCH